MADDLAQGSSKGEKSPESMDATSTDTTNLPIKEKKIKKKSSRDTTEASSVSETDDKEDSESASTEHQKQKKSKKVKADDSAAQVVENEESNIGEHTPVVGPTHAKDIPGVVASFNSCVVKAKKGAKHDCEYDINIERFCKAFYDLLPVLRLLGTAFYFVEKDIVQKLEAIAKNKEKSEDGDHKQNLIDFIQWEKDTKPNIRSDKHSSARHALRLMRALHFISLFLDKLNEPGVEPKPAAKDAYAVSLSHYHPWSVRTAVSVAFYTLPYRKSFLKELHMDPNASGLFVDFVAATTKIRETLNTYYDANDWQNLP